MRQFRLLLLYVFICFGATQALGQYGFEWIKPYQPYAKFTISKAGVYAIDSAFLQRAGLNPQQVLPNRVQVFKHGSEVPLAFLPLNASNTFTGNNRLCFWAQPNDGKLDTEMYRSAAEQPNTFNSLFTDTAVYFITVLPDTTVIVPKRFVLKTDSLSAGLVAEPFFQQSAHVAPLQEYYRGGVLPSRERYYISEYADAEGWMSNLIGLGQSATFQVQTPFPVNSGNAMVQIKVIGASDFAVALPNQPNHHIRIFAGNTPNPNTLIADTTYRGYGERIINRVIPASLLGNTTFFRIEVINDLGVLSDFNGLSYITVAYNQQNTWQANQAQIFELNSFLNQTNNRLLVNGFTGTAPFCLDLTNQQLVQPHFVNAQLSMVLTYTPQMRKYVLFDANNMDVVTNVKPVSFTQFTTLQQPEFLLVSNKELTNSAQQYFSYRSQKYRTLLAYTDELADYYFYGYHHPLAIKRFANHMFNESVVKPKFLLLLGRGYQNSLIRNNADNFSKNLVPAIGEPSSDNLFTSNSNGVPQIATGRVPAATNQEALNYLSKLIRLETHPDSIALWRKHFLHLSGGTFLGEQQDFTREVNALRATVLTAPTGANVFSYHKNTTLPTQTNLRQTLINHLNEGINVMTFLGHGSLTVLDMDFGGVNDLTENNKPVFFYFNGCNIGNANDVDPLGTGLVYGKDFICAANKGAIGWLAHSNITFTGTLYTQMRNFYNQLGNLGYGLPVGLNIQQALSASSNGTDDYAKSHALQLILQGDPAFTVYGPTLPDPKIADNDLFIFPPNANAQSDSLAVGIIVSNLARAVADTFDVQIRRTLPDNSTENITIKLPLPFYKDTVYAWFKVNNNQVGNNSFQAELNPTRSGKEINFNNNIANLTYFLPGSGLQLLMPYAYQVVGSTDSISLIVQNNNLFVTQNEYLFELDTSPFFTSPALVSSNVVKANSLATFKFKPAGNLANATFFWRARLNLPPNAGGIWQTSSFTCSSSASGFTNNFVKDHYHQVRQISASDFMLFNDTAGRIEFADDEFTLGIENRRWDHRRMGVTIPYLLNAGVGSCISQGVVALVFTRFRADYPEELANYPFNCAHVQANKFDPSVRYYTFNTNIVAGEDELKRFIDSIPLGYYVAMFSRYSSNINNWKPENKQALSLLGSVKIPAVGSPYTAWGLIGQKGAEPGYAAEDTVYNSDLSNAPNLPPLDNEPQDTKPMDIRKNVKQKWFYGTFTTDAFGVAVSWLSLNIVVEPKQTGRYWFDVIGITRNGNDTLLLANQTAATVSLTQFNANQIPRLKVRFGFVDSVAREPHQINRIHLSYVAPPEVTILPDSGYYFYANNMQQGDTVRLQIPLFNLSGTLFDSAIAQVIVTDQNRIIRYQHSQKINAIQPQSTLLYKHQFSSVGLGSNNMVAFTFNPNGVVAEQNLNNNFVNHAVNLQNDNKRPLLEVTFDGQRIMNGDIVSPNPVIRMVSTDDSRFMLQNDTQTFNVMFKRPNQTDFERIGFTHPNVQFIAANGEKNQAVLLFEPKDLTDGVHKLKIQSRDASGNTAATNDFEIDFNVITKSTITHFYPYPNPFTTSTRFVFTLTGSEIPTDLLIRIFTVSGKLVREVTKEEFGTIRIGNNISGFAWDGTDMFGDRLANGVYLYQVLTRINGKTIERRNTRAKDENSYFINNTGKIYLMR